MAQAIWRFQCDPTGDDPLVTVFVGDVVNGVTVQNTANPLQIKRSELAKPGDLFDLAALTAIVVAAISTYSSTGDSIVWTGVNSDFSLKGAPNIDGGSIALSALQSSYVVSFTGGHDTTMLLAVSLR